MTLLAGATEVVTRSGLLPIAELTGRRYHILVPKVTPYGIHGHGVFQPVEVRSGGAQPLWAVTLHRGRQTRVIHTAAGQVWLTRVRKLRPPKPNGGHNGYETVTATAPTNELASGDRVRSLKAHPPLRTGMVPFAVAQGFVYGDGTKASGGRPADMTIYDHEKDRALLPYFAAHEVRPITANGKEALRIYGLPRLWKEAPDFRESRAPVLACRVLRCGRHGHHGWLRTHEFGQQRLDGGDPQHRRRLRYRLRTGPLCHARRHRR